MKIANDLREPSDPEAINIQRIERVLAWLIRNERVNPDAISRAVSNAVDMRIGEAVALDGDNQAMREAFVMQESRRLQRR